MTTTDRKVTRRTRYEYSVLYPKARPIVVSILPGDVIEFREHGRRSFENLRRHIATKHPAFVANETEVLP